MRVRGDESREVFHAWFESIEMGFAHYFDGELVGRDLVEELAELDELVVPTVFFPSVLLRYSAECRSFTLQNHL